MYLSIIIPTLNEEKYLPELISAIKRQTFTDFEIIVADAGSNDNTQKIARDNSCQLVVDDAVRHPSHQRNVGARIAHGEVLLFFDADTDLPNDFLEKVINEFKSRNLTAAGFYIQFNPNHALYKIFAGTLNFFCWGRQYTMPAAVGAGLLAKREAHNKINGFDESIYVAEDYDYCYRISKIGHFRMIKSEKLLYSSRRLEKDGKLKTMFKWLKMFLFTFFNLKIKKKIVKYDFGKY